MNRCHLASALFVLGASPLLGSAVAAPPRPAVLTTTPKDSLVDAPVRARIGGLAPRALVTIRARTTAADGRRWESWASFRIDKHGRVDLASASPIRGTYSRRDRMGLFWSMRPARSGGASTDISLMVAAPRARVTLTASESGRRVARTSITRRLRTAAVTVQAQKLPSDGFVGRYFSLPTSAPGPAILLLGGSEGGLPLDDAGSLLASHGYPTLDLAYFGAPGLPQALKNVPLEYFERALQWLGEQPGVDARKLIVLGTSRGGEAALLLGATYPNLIHGVVAYVPSSVVYGTPGDPSSPAWTLAGKPVPYSRGFFNPASPDQPKAIIPVERINGPIFLVGGVFDYLWPSSRFVSAIVERLRAHKRADFTALVYPEAGHAIGTAVPNLPVGTRVKSRYGALELGGSRAADSAARADSWPRLLRYLKRLRATN